MEKRDHDQVLQDKIEKEKEAARKHNAQLLPERPGFVRIDGPRRQYRLEILEDGTRHYIEI